MSVGDLPNGTANDEPLSFDDGVVGIDALLDPQDADLEEDDQATNEAEAEPEEDDIDGDEVEGDDEADAEEDDEAEEDEDGPDDAEASKTAADDAVVTLDDGTQITVGELKRNNLFQRDYSRKTEALKREGETLQEQKERVEQAAEALREHREFLLRVYQQTAPQPPQPLTAEEANNDPIAYNNYLWEKEQYENKLAEWQYMQQFSQAEMQRKEAENAQKQQEFVQKERERMLERIPEFKDSAKLETFKTDAVKFGSEIYEFSPEEVLAVSDSRYLAVLKDAIEFRKLKAKAPAVKQKVQGKPKMLRGSKRVDPQTKNTREAKAKADRLRKTGSFDAGIAALMDLDL